MLSLKLNQAINAYPTKVEVCRGGREQGGNREGEGRAFQGPINL
jgi:hypothetical protein